MTTGIIGVMGGSATLTYSPKCDSKVMISGCSAGYGGQILVNGTVMRYIQASGDVDMIFYVGAGQTVTITTSNPYISAIVSCLEEVS